METAVDRRIAFINPFGTAAFDAIIEETLVPYAANGTSVDVIHLEGVPANIDYYYPKHLMELAIFDEVRRLEERGYDAVVVGCCYDRRSPARSARPRRGAQSPSESAAAG